VAVTLSVSAATYVEVPEVKTVAPRLIVNIVNFVPPVACATAEYEPCALLPRPGKAVPIVTAEEQSLRFDICAVFTLQ